MGGFQRYAVYAAPRPETALGRFGAAWLGWDAEAGGPCDGIDLPGLPRPRAELTEAPRRYGFHGTLKAPFHLAEGVAPAALDAALAATAARLRPIALPLTLTALGPFLALTPSGDSPALAALAAACVRDLDALRAPLNPEQMARRRAAGLTPRQDALLLAWGYPYVLDEFQFHLTLTGPLAPGDEAATAAALAPALAPLLAEPMTIADLCLFGEAADGRFHVVTRHALGAAAAPP